VDDFDDANVINTFGFAWNTYWWSTGTVSASNLDNSLNAHSGYSLTWSGTSPLGDGSTGFGCQASLGGADIHSFFNGLGFYIRTNTPATLRVQINSLAQSGSDAPFGCDFLTTTGWTQVYLPLASFTTQWGVSSVPLSACLSAMTSFQWTSAGNAYTSPLTIWLDDVCIDSPVTPTPTVDTSTLTPSPTPSPTDTATPTPSPTDTATPDSYGTTCFNPVVWGFRDSLQTFKYNFISGNKIKTQAYTYFPGEPIRLSWFDGSNQLISESSLTTGTDGFARNDYTIAGSEDTTAPWHLVLSRPSQSIPLTYSGGHVSYLDDEAVTVMLNAPTPIATPSCANMPALFADKTYQMEKYKYKKDVCTTVFYQLRWAYQNAIAAFYDGAGNLVFQDLLTSSNSYKTWYRITGSETSGTWHIVLYKETSTPPSSYAGAGDFGPCLPDIINVTAQ